MRGRWRHDDGGDVHFGILGPLEVVGADGQPLDLGPPKQRAVLALLLVAAGRVVPLDRLVDELWAADEPPAQATLSLQSYVARLRRILEPGRDPKRPSRLIVSRSPGWLLAVDGHTVDAVRFVELAADGHRQLAAGAAENAAAALRPALALWRGDALMEFGGLPTAAVEAVRLAELRAGALEDLLDAELALGAAAAVVAEAERALVDQPYRERLWRTLALGLYRAGRQADALAALTRARARLADDLGLDPGPELRALETAVRRHDPELELRPAAAARAPASPVPPPSVPPPSVPPPPVPPFAAAPLPAPAPVPTGAAPAAALSGRDREVASLRLVLDALADGTGRLVLLSGPAGIGKTTLLAAAERLADGVATFARGTAIDADPPPAYWPWIAVLRALADRLGAAELGALLGEHAQFVAVLDPVLGRAIGAAAPERLALAELNRSRLMHGIADAFASLARRRPVVVALDDMHWADPASVDLLAAVASRLASAQIALLVSYRADEVPDGSALGVALSRLSAGSAVVHLPLAGLDRAGVRACLEALTGTPDAAIADALLDRTGGNPLFVSELIRMLASERSLDVERVRTGAAPPVVQQVLHRRLRRLPEQTNAVLTVAAAIGRWFDVGALGRVLGLADEPVQEALDSAIVSGLLDDLDDTGPIVRFSHDLVRQTLYDGLTGLRRARLHAEIGRVLAEHPGSTAASLAHHFRLAAPVLDPATVVPRLSAAAAEAVDAFAYEQAQSLFEQALLLSETTAAGEQRDTIQLDLHVRLGVIEQTLRGEASPVVDRHFQELITLLGRARVTAAVVPALMCAPTGFLLRGRVEDMVAFAGDIERRAEPASADVIAAVARYLTGVARVVQGRHPEAAAQLEAGLRLCRATPPAPYPGFDGWDVELGMLQFACLSAAVIGDVDAAERHLRVSRDIAARAGTDFTTIYADYTESYLAFVLRDPVRALGSATSIRRAAVPRGYRSYAAFGRAVAGWAQVLTGTAAGLADVEAVAADPGAHGIGGGSRDGYLQLLYAQALHTGGRPADALRVAERAIDHAGADLLGAMTHELFLARARALAALGNDAAGDAARAAARIAEERGARTAAGEARRLLAELRLEA